MHSAPFMAFSGAGQVDLARAVKRTELLEPLYAGGRSAPIFNIDGLYTHSPARESSRSYFQIFRNGIVEAVDAQMIPSRHPYPDAVPSELFPTKLFAYVARLMQLYDLLEVEPPYALFVSLLGVRGIRLDVHVSKDRNLRPLDRDVLMLPELVIDTRTFEPDVKLRPLLDTLWQSFGAHEYTNYEEKRSLVRRVPLRNCAPDSCGAAGSQRSFRCPVEHGSGSSGRESARSSDYS